jgi:hypothetical protein
VTEYLAWLGVALVSGSAAPDDDDVSLLGGHLDADLGLGGGGPRGQAIQYHPSVEVLVRVSGFTVSPLALGHVRDTFGDSRGALGESIADTCLGLGHGMVYEEVKIATPSG